MAAVLQFARPQPLLRQPPQLPTAPTAAQQLRDLPDWARMEAERCLAIIRPALARMQQGVSRRGAAQWLASTAEGLPSWKTIDRWLEQYQNGGSNIVALAPKYTGRVRKERGWEARALELFNRPQKPAYATVAYWLREEGYADAEEHLVRRYLKRAPSDCTETGRKRLGLHHYNQNIRPHVTRDSSVLPVGAVYEGDGHCCDVYVAHPGTGHPFRPEFTPWLDVRSEYVVSWWISEAESAHTTLFSLSEALVRHRHVPAYVHTDPGSGFKARMISDEVTGFLARFHITPILALPGNAKGKGLVEGWFRWFEERLGKKFETYCGHDRSDDYLRHLRVKVRSGKIVLPTLAQYRDAIRQYIHAYNNTPKESLGGRTPAQLWAELQHSPLETPAEAVIRPREQRTVQRWGVKLDGRTYRAGELAHYEKRQIVIEYTLHDDARVWCYDASGRFICEALLVEKKAWMPASRLEEGLQKRLEGQRQRKLRNLAEDEARARSPLAVTTFLDALDGHATTIAHAPSPLELGHSIPTGQPDAPRAARTTHAASAPDEAEIAYVRESLAEQDDTETPEQRFTRWLDLRAQLERGEPIPAEQSPWYRSYPESAEWQGLADIYESFGYLPGATAAPR